MYLNTLVVACYDHIEKLWTENNSREIWADATCLMLKYILNTPQFAIFDLYSRISRFLSPFYVTNVTNANTVRNSSRHFEI